MFSKVLQELKKRLEAKPSPPSSRTHEPKEEELQDDIANDSADILTYLDLHGTTDKDDQVFGEERHDNKEVTGNLTSCNIDDNSLFDEEGWSTGGEEILAWVDKEGVEYKSADMPRAPKVSRNDHKTKKAHELIVDLHGLRKEGALKRINRAMATAKREGYGQVLIIHGRGNHTEGGRGKLKAMVYDILETDLADQVASYGFAPPNEGGGGATRVILK